MFSPDIFSSTTMVADTSYLPSPTPVPPDDEGSSVIYLQEAMRKCDVEGGQASRIVTRRSRGRASRARGVGHPGLSSHQKRSSLAHQYGTQICADATANVQKVLAVSFLPTAVPPVPHCSTNGPTAPWQAQSLAAPAVQRSPMHKPLVNRKDPHAAPKKQHYQPQPHLHAKA